MCFGRGCVIWDVGYVCVDFWRGCGCLVWCVFVGFCRCGGSLQLSMELSYVFAFEFLE